MKTVPFSEVAVGAKFLYNNNEYVKINAVKISCCKSINAHAVSNPQSKIFVNPNSQVNINA